jgi:Na+:H+ antiporter, NhaA family
MPRPRRRLFATTDRAETTFVGNLLRQETVGGAAVLAAAAFAVLWANSPFADAYESLRTLQLGPLDVQHWAADGALALFFFLAGLELKRELLVGSLRRPADALVPIVSALAGVAVPAIVYTVVNLAGGGPLVGWAIPAATDIAFALAVLAVVGSSLPSQLRAFLLTLAVVDDLVVIAIIAVFYTSTVQLLPLLGAVALLGCYVALQRMRIRSRLIYVPLALACWWCMHESGVHATIAGVALGLLTRVIPDPDEHGSPAERLEHRLTPYSTGLAVPLFALLTAGVPIRGGVDLLSHPVMIGVVLGLVVGKPLGVMAGAWTVTRFTRAELNDEIGWRDIFGVAVLAGVGFTVALLVSGLSFDGEQAEVAKTAVLLGSVLAALLAAALLGRRSRVHRSG